MENIKKNGLPFLFQIKQTLKQQRPKKSKKVIHNGKELHLIRPNYPNIHAPNTRAPRSIK